MKELLTQLQKSHREDIYTYTSGHLNPDKLYRPPETVVQHWYNANRPKEKPATFPPTFSRGKKVAKMKDAWVYFSVNTALHPSDTYSSKLFRYLNPQMFHTLPLNDDVTSEESSKKEKVEEEGGGKREEKASWLQLFSVCLPCISFLIHVTNLRTCKKTTTKMTATKDLWVEGEF